ncbi:hypothetical protein LX32DRAFT_684419 [Colletotrichum zoysiae]|uniref:Hypersensitive response-inducing protein n=1 Tax=Colletotrichum zoysiae TaxID=1216348 RepID=A0AAD9M2P6_9PEZI|nr:hypothetical protein LX32DRAFT_684419 [Colletotrichum zoysiae]
MRFTTSSVLAAALLAASTSAAPTSPTSPPPFCQEYSLTDGVNCTTADNGKTFQCADGLVSANVAVSPGKVQLTSNNGNQAGVKVTCGASSSTYFVDRNAVMFFAQAACDGTVPASVITVRSAKQLALPGVGQQLDFTDGTPCTQEANGGFLCGDSQGATISEAQGNVTMVAGQSDAAIKPTCAGGFKSVISVKSAAPILRTFG